MFIVDLHGFFCVRVQLMDYSKTVLAKGPGLQEEASLLERIQINKLYRRAVSIESGYQGSDILRQTGSSFKQVKITQPNVQQPAVVNDLWPAAG